MKISHSIQKPNGVIFLVVLSVFAAGFSAPNKGQTIIPKLEKRMLPAPSGLVNQGVCFFDLTIEYSKVVINLYDALKNRVATVELNEEPGQDLALLKIQPTNSDEAWLRIERQRKESEQLYSIANSVGGTLNIRLETTEPPSKNSAIPVRSVSVDLGNGWTQLPLDNLTADVEANPLKVEENRLFATPPLELLRAVLHEYGNLQREAFGVETPLVVGCTVLCWHIVLLAPIYWCDGGQTLGCSCPGGDGVFIITGCTIVAPCPVPCGVFYPY